MTTDSQDNYKSYDLWKLKRVSTKWRSGQENTNKPSNQVKLSISQWNARSVQTETKIQFLQALSNDIITVQEIWRQTENLRKVGELIGVSEREISNGGGSATLKLNEKIVVKSKIEVNMDTHAVKLFVNNSYIWIVNTYLCIGNMESIQNLFGKIRSLIPENEWNIICCLGDFNVDLTRDSQEKKLIEKLCKFMRLRIIVPSTHTRKKAILDFMLAGKNIDVKELVIVNSPSDHRAITWELGITPLQRRKAIKIPCKESANMISTLLINDPKVTDATSFVRKLGELKARNSRRIWKMLRPKPFKNDILLKALLDLQTPQEIEITLNNYWKDLWEETELTRYSTESAKAYKTLKKILKYHLFEKRDGGIINCIRKEDDTIETETEKVNELLLTSMKEIQIDEKWEYLQEKEFPKLNRLNEKQMEHIIGSLATGKAIAFDGISDELFKDENEKSNGKQDNGKIKDSNFKKTAKILRNLWRTPLHKFDELQDTWDTRLIPLNKVFPNIPGRKDLRPIAVQSPLVKLLEARFLPKLQDYLNQKLDRSQTGFIQKMGIQVNLVRALERIKLRTDKGRCVYGLFIDFSNAYNSIPHCLLFKKLREKKVLEEDEINYLEQLYSRYRLRIGKARIRSNKGVAQGSVISPALFNIFIEDLSDELKLKTGINFEDLLYYADDLLALCTSIEQVRTAIKIISDWSIRNGMQLNKKKSGIVVFGDRRSKDIPMMKRVNNQGKGKVRTNINKLIPAISSVEGVPICDKYKYLGTILTPKLICGEQISFIRRKSGFIFVKLYPYLKNASADARKDIWQTMVKPLFNAALVLLEYEPSKTQKENLERVWRGTFKQFMMIGEHTSTVLVNKMINCDIQMIASNLVSECKKQWDDRKSFRQLEPKKKLPKMKNFLRGVSNKWCDIVNFQSNFCIKCRTSKEICNSLHLRTKHGIVVKDIQKVWDEDICPITNKAEGEPRNIIRDKVNQVLKKYIKETEVAKLLLLKN